MSDEFTISGVGFRMKPIPLTESEKVYRSLVPILTPLIALAADGMKLTAETLTASMTSMPTAVDQLPKLHDFFVRYCSTQLPGEYAGAWMDLDKKAFCDKAFPPRSHARHLEWIVRCIIAEYGTFLSELWEQAAAHMQKAESQSQSPSGSAGTSTE